MVTTRDGLWLGAWDKEAFAAYTQFAIDAAVAQYEQGADVEARLGDEARAEVKRLRAAVAEARAVPDGWNVCKVDPGFRWDGDAQQHVPQVLVEFAPVPANAPTDSPGWLARDAFVAALAATPSPAEQPKPAVVDLPDSIRVPLHRLWADAGYLIGRAKNGETDLAVHTIKALCDELERAIRAALSGEQT